MGNYIKRVGEDSGLDLRKALAAKLREQMNQPIPEIHSHTQGIAEALGKGIEGFQLGREESLYKKDQEESKERQLAQNKAMIDYFRGQGIFGDNEGMTQGQPQEPSRYRQDMSEESSFGEERMQGGRSRQSSFDPSNFSPEIANLEIDRRLKDQEQTRKEKFQSGENAKNRSHAFELAAAKSKLNRDAHKDNKQAEVDIKKAAEWEEQAEAAQEANRHIQFAEEALPGAKPGTAFHERKVLATAVSRILGPESAKKLGLGNLEDMQQLQKSLTHLYIKVLKTVPGSRILKVEAEEAKKAISEVTDAPESIQRVLTTLKPFNDYLIFRNRSRKEWEDAYGSLKAKDPEGRRFADVVEQIAEDNIFAPLSQGRKKNVQPNR